MQNAQSTLPTDYILSQAAAILPSQYFRSRHMIGNRLRRRERNSRIVPALIECRSELPSRWDGHSEQAQNSTW